MSELWGDDYPHELPWKWGPHLKWGLVSLLTLMMVYLLYVAATLNSDMVQVTDMVCYQNDTLVYEGVARGLVPVPVNQAPWVFTDHATGNEIVIGAYCDRRNSHLISTSEKEED